MSKHWKTDFNGNLNPEYDPNIGFLDKIMTRFSIGINEISKNVAVCEMISEINRTNYDYYFLLHQIFSTTTKMIAIDLYKLFEGKNSNQKSTSQSFSVHKY